MNALSPRSQKHQRGMVTLMAVLILVTVVIFVLSQSLGIFGTSSVDNKQQLDNAAALFMAESGLERGQYVLNNSGTLSDSVCTGMAGTFTPSSPSRGGFTLSATSKPATCNNAGSTLCTSCAITSAGTVGLASRTLTRTVGLTPNNGVAGTGTVVQMTLKNTYANSAVAIFNLAMRMSGSSTAALCNSVNGITCARQWNLQSSNGGGNQSVGGMGVGVTIPGLNSASIIQTLDSSRSYAEVGALFPGTATPSILGSYWDDSSGPGTKTIGDFNNSDSSTGGTNNGTACLPTAPVTSTCPATTTPPNPIPNQGSSQASKSWCYGGDTLVFGFSGRSSALADVHLTNVTFGPNSTSLTNVARFPNTSITNAAGDVYSEVWYVRNPNLSPTTTAANVSSYKGNGTASIGATWTGANNSASGTTLTVSTFAGYPTARISIGDIIASAGGSGNNISGSPTIVSQLSSTETGGALGGRGTYQLSSSQSVSASSARTWTASSTVLNVSACAICYFAQGDAISGLVAGRTINAAQLTLQTSEATGGKGRYPLSGTAIQVNSAAVLAGTPGTTLYLPATESMPSVTTPNTQIALVLGTGVLAASTKVTLVTSPAPNTATKAFTVSSAPTTPLSLATLCGGTCALFNQASGSTTAFNITKTTGDGTRGWAAGLVCLKGADITPIPVTSTTVKTNNWHEVVN